MTFKACWGTAGGWIHSIDSPSPLISTNRQAHIILSKKLKSSHSRVASAHCSQSCLALIGEQVWLLLISPHRSGSQNGRRSQSCLACGCTPVVTARRTAEQQNSRKQQSHSRLGQLDKQLNRSPAVGLLPRTAWQHAAQNEGATAG